MKRRAGLIGALLGSVLLSACTFVPTDSEPQTIAKRTVPFNLLEKTLPPQPKVHFHYVDRPIWLINSSHQLAARPRRVPSTNSVAVSLEALFGGPTDFETGLGFASQVPATWHVSGIGSSDGMIFVRLTAPTTPTVPASALESGQLVITTAGTTNSTVEVLINNQALKMTLPDGEVSLQVRATDYVSLEAR
jgi:hypothetical protein